MAVLASSFLTMLVASAGLAAAASSASVPTTATDGELGLESMGRLA
jgi:hypothetical protein